MTENAWKGNFMLTQEEDQVSFEKAAKGRALRACSRAKPMLEECRSCWRRETGEEEEEEPEATGDEEEEEEGIGLSTMMEAGRLRDCIFQALRFV